MATSWVFTLVFSGRGALIHTGALMATMMTGNVFFVIMPNQRKSVAALLAGKKPDPKWVKTSKTRSTHNNYITLPVLFMMLSNHYPMAYSNPRVIPAIVTCVIVAGALIRYFYNRWHADHAKAPWWAWGVAAAAIALRFRRRGDRLARHAQPHGAGRTSGRAARADEPKAPQEVVDVVQLRCMMCHAAEPMEWIGEAPKGVLLDTPEHIARFAPAIAMQAVLTHAMPPNNFSEITDEERAVLRALAQARRGREMTPGLSDAERAAGARLMARLDAFAAFTDEPGRLTRLFLSDAHRRAAAAFIGWCAEAGLEARIDAAGNVVARYEGRTAGAPALMLGSHIDTVRDAGRYDGNYGALAALARRRGPGGGAASGSTTRSRSSRSATRRACATAPR